MRGREVVVGLVLGLLALAGLWLARGEGEAAERPDRAPGPEAAAVPRAPSAEPPAREGPPSRLDPAASPVAPDKPAGRAAEGPPAASTAAAPDAPAPTAQTDSAGLEGRVSSPAGAVEGARVALYAETLGPLPEEPEAATTSGADGGFQLEELPPGPALLVVSADGLSPRRIALLLQAGATTRRDVSLAPLRALRGTVVDEGGQPLAGIVLATQDAAGATVQAVSDRSGAFAFDGLPAGPVGVAVVDGRGYGDPYGGGIRQVRPGQDALRIVLSAVGGLELTVVTAEGRPVAGAEVAWEAERPPGWRPLRVTCDSAGQALLSPLPPGPCAVRCRAPGFAPEAASAEVPALGSAPLRIVLDAGGEVRGTVRDTGGRPLAGALVGWLDPTLGEDGAAALESQLRPLLARGSDSTALLLARTDEEGGYRLRGLPRGSVQLLALAPEHQARVRGVTVEAGPIAPLDFALEPSGALTVTVLDAEGRSVPYPAWRLYAASGTERRGSAGAEGDFAVGGLAAGPYVLIVVAPSRAALSLPVTVGPGAATPLTVRFAREATLRGRVLRARGPVAGATVEARDGLLSEHASTGPDGTFELALQPGSWELVVRHREFILRSSVELPETGGEVELTVPRGLFSGELRDDFGEKLAGELVLFDREDRRIPVPVGADGSFAIDGLAEGPYRFRASAPGRATALGLLQLLGDETRRDFPLEPGMVLVGAVRDAAGQPLDAALTVVDPEALGRGLPARWTGESAADGSFAVGGLPALRALTVFAERPGYAPTRLRTTTDGSPITLTLAPAATLDVTVLQAGVPVEGATLALLFDDGGALDELPSLRALWPLPSVTGADGRLLRAGLGAGRYRLDVAAGAERRSVAVELSAGGIEAVRVELP